MIFLGILFVVAICGLLILFRWTGRMGTRPSAQERAKHAESDRPGRGPRATAFSGLPYPCCFSQGRRSLLVASTRYPGFGSQQP